MTRFGNRLAAEFDWEFSRLANEWYLQWHALARGEAIDLDDFRGGRIRLDGVRFDASAEHAYWSAARRYARGKIDEAFTQAENRIRARMGFGAEAIADDTASPLRSFLERVHRHAIFTEYRLKARGYPDERYLAARRDDAVAAEIRRRRLALIERYRSLPLRRKIALAATHFAGKRRQLRPALIAAVLLVLVFGLSRDSAVADWPTNYPPPVSRIYERALSNDRTDATLDVKSDSFTTDQIGASRSSIAPPGVA